MRSFKAGCKFGAYLLCVALLAPLQALILAAFAHNQAVHSRLPQLFQKLTCLIFGIRIEIAGAPVRGRQTLFMSNHISYLDIPALGAVIPASFVAKKEVKSWPGVNLLAYLQQTAFIERKATAIRRETDALSERLDQKHSFIIFPEGTSSDGRQIWPFKSSLFSLATARPLAVQPVTLSVLSVNGQNPADQNVRELYAWHLHMDIPLGPHFWNFAKGSGARLKITFQEPLESSAFSDRKELARICQAFVSQALAIPH